MLSFLLAVQLSVVAPLPPQGDAAAPARGSDLAIRAGEPLSSVLARLSAVTGTPVQHAPDLGARLAATGCGLLRDAEVPAPAALSFVGGLLCAGGFALSAVEGDPSKGLRIEQEELATAARLDASAADVRALAANPALLVRVPLELASLDARQVPACFRPFAVRPDWLRLESVRAGLVLDGPAGAVADACDELRAVDRRDSTLGGASAALLAPATGRLATGPYASLLDLLVAYGAAADLELCVAADLQRKLAGLEVGAELALDPEGVHRGVQAVLVRNRLSLVRLATAPPLLAVAEGVESFPPRRVPVGLERLDALAEVPALVVVACVPTPGLDARLIPAGIRPFAAGRSCSIAAFGREAVLVGGAAHDVRDVALRIRAADAAGDPEVLREPR